MKKNILFLILGMIIAGGISVVAYQMNATQITYEPKDKDWNVNTVKAAIDDIKSNAKNYKTAIFAGDSIPLREAHDSLLEPIWYDSDYFNYDSTTKVYTVKEKCSLVFYVSQGWSDGRSGSKVQIDKNEKLYKKFHFDSKSVQQIECDLEPGDTIKISNWLDYYDSSFPDKQYYSVLVAFIK